VVRQQQPTATNNKKNGETVAFDDSTGSSSMKDLGKKVTLQQPSTSDAIRMDGKFASRCTSRSPTRARKMLTLDPLKVIDFYKEPA
jgi:hypothetical protein